MKRYLLKKQKISKKIVSQNIAILTGQNDNIRLGANPWNRAINADKLAFAYRQWLNKELKNKSPWFESFNNSPKKNT